MGINLQKITRGIGAALSNCSKKGASELETAAKKFTEESEKMLDAAMQGLASQGKVKAVPKHQISVIEGPKKALKKFGKDASKATKIADGSGIKPARTLEEAKKSLRPIDYNKLHLERPNHTGKEILDAKLKPGAFANHGAIEDGITGSYNNVLPDVKLLTAEAIAAGVKPRAAIRGAKATVAATGQMSGKSAKESAEAFKQVLRKSELKEKFGSK